MPLRATGLRFMHFALAGLFVAVALPLGLVFLRARFDPRIRSPLQLKKIADLPLLTVIPTYHTPRDKRQQYTRTAMSIGMVVVVFLAYGVVFALNLLNALCHRL